MHVYACTEHPCFHGIALDLLSIVNSQSMYACAWSSFHIDVHACVHVYMYVCMYVCTQKLQLACMQAGHFDFAPTGSASRQLPSSPLLLPDKAHLHCIHAYVLQNNNNATLTLAFKCLCSSQGRERVCTRTLLRVDLCFTFKTIYICILPYTSAFGHNLGFRMTRNSGKGKRTGERRQKRKK